MRGESASASAGACSPRTRSTAMSLRGSKWTASASMPGSSPRSSTRVSFWPATTWALVTTMPVAGDPARALDAQPAGRAEHLHDAARGRVDLRIADDPRRRRLHAHLRPVDARERVEVLERGQQPAGRRQDRVQALEHVRALDGLAQLAARAERHRAQHPDDPEPDAGGQRRAQETVERAARGRAHARPQPVADALEAHRQHRARRERADQAERGRPARVGALGEHERADPRPDPRADREADQRERAGHESLGPSEQGQQDHDPQDDPIEPRHLPE